MSAVLPVLRGMSSPASTPAVERGFPLSHDDHEIIPIEQNAQALFSGELSGRSPGIHPVQRLPVWIAMWPVDEFSQTVDESLMSTAADLTLIPSSSRLEADAGSLR